MDRSDRRQNLVVKGLPESGSENIEVRREYDLKMVAELLENTKVISEPEARGVIVAVRRIGKPGPESTRPLLVRFRSQENRDEILRKYGKAAQANKIKIEPDLTREQRKEYIEMWEEADKRTKNALKMGRNTRWFVWGPKECPKIKQRPFRSEQEREELRKKLESMD